MRTGNTLFSAVHLFVVSFILVLGLIIYLLPMTAEYRIGLANLLMHQPKFLSYFGLILIISGVLLFIGFYFLNRRSYYTVELNKDSFSTSEQLVKELLLNYWPRVFPEDELPQDVYLNRKKEIEIFLPCKKTFDEQEVFLKKIGEQMGALLRETIGYNSDIKVHVII